MYINVYIDVYNIQKISIYYINIFIYSKLFNFSCGYILNYTTKIKRIEIINRKTANIKYLFFVN